MTARGLARKVRDIASSATISTAKKERRISTAVRVAVVAATAYKSDPDEVLGIAFEFAEAAARAAPRFADVISNAVSFSPAVSRIGGAAGRIRTATYAAAKGSKRRKALVAAPPPNSDSEQLAETTPTEAPAVVSRAQSRSSPQAEGADTAPVAAVPESDAASQVASTDTSSDGSRVSEDQMQSDAAPAGNSSDETAPRTLRPSVAQGENEKLSVTADISAQHDDNVFFSGTNKVSDTIYSFNPGLQFEVGQNSLDHGSLQYHENFERYAKHSAPNVNLASAAGDFGYDDGGLKLTATGSYQQFFQNNIDVLSFGPQALIRSDTLSLAGDGELQLGGKTSASLGVTFSKINYSGSQLLSSQQVDFPLHAYYKITPKVDLSAGYTYGIYKPQSGGPNAKDGYTNIGARGQFTPKLAGEVTVGYITRDVAGPLKFHSLGFTGALNYEVTAKTSATLAFDRSFYASAIGQNQTTGTYTLGLTTSLDPQWEIGNNLNYQIIDYGPQVFLLNNSPTAQLRKDDFLTDTFHLTYLYSSWLSATAAYTLRNDHSTVSAIDFSDDVISLTLGLRY